MKNWKWILPVSIMLIVSLVSVNLTLIPIHFSSGRRCHVDIRVLSYNVNSQEARFKAVSKKLVGTILNQNPDFVFLTEYYGTASDILQNEIVEYYPFSNNEYRFWDENGDVFFSKWNIDSINRFSLSGHYSSIYRVQIHRDADTLAVYCCHLSSNNLALNKGRWASLNEGRRLRNEEVDIITDAIVREQYSTLVIGDLNDVSWSDDIKRIRSSGLSDGWAEKGTGYGSTYSEGWLKLRIDHVLYDKQRMELNDIRIVGNYLWSDHRAIVASFVLK